jgi:DNA-binding transcriptional MerR regulator
MNQPALRIGELAARAGISVDAVRYYERRRLLPHAARSSGGFRLFAPEAVARIRFIKQAQDLGFSLAETRELLTPGDDTKCRRVRDLLRAKLTELDERMKAMSQFRDTLAQYLLACERALKKQGEVVECPVIVELTHPSVEPEATAHQEQRKL